ncbi:MAG: DUF6326 family protein [Ferruginibacter sp.]
MNSDKTSINNFKDCEVNIKIKLSVLWASVTLCYLYGDYFELYVPTKVQGLVGGQNILDSPIKLFAASALLAIPALMVFLSILLKPSINRWLNIIFGIFFTTIMLFIALNSITPWLAFYVFLAIVEVGITSLIVWHAWTWPKQ